MSEVANNVGPLAVDAKLYSDTLALSEFSDNVPSDDIENASHFKYHYFQLYITNYSGSLVVRVEGTMGDGRWFNLDSNNADTSYTANGTYLLDSTRAVRCQKVRLKKISGTGTINATYRGGN